MDEKQPNLGWLHTDRAHGLIFDGGMLLVSYLLLRSLTATSVDAYEDRQIGLLLGIGMLAHLLGALLKRGPLQERLHGQRKTPTEDRENLLGCLSFFHFIFFLVVVAMSLGLVGMVDVDAVEGFKEFAWGFTSLAAAGLLTGTVWLAIRNPSDEREPVIWWPYQEVVADMLLVISATILTHFFWTALFVESEPPSFMGFSQRALVYVTAVSALFLVFYVPSRLLFLAEDYRYPTTWLRLWLVAMFPLLAIVFVR